MSKEVEPIPFGYCQCGCGAKTSIILKSTRTRGLVAGQPMRYIQTHNSRMGVPLMERFAKCVDLSNPDGCWTWIGFMDGRGYGCFSIGKKLIRAHRLAYELAWGPFSPNLFVCHHCDNRRCVNPWHLFLGTAKDNLQDASRKGRMHLGEKDGQAKLTVAAVLEIRTRYADGATQRELAKEFCVSQSEVSDVVMRNRWQHVGGPLAPERRVAIHQVGPDKFSVQFPGKQVRLVSCGEKTWICACPKRWGCSHIKALQQFCAVTVAVMLIGVR